MSQATLSAPSVTVSRDDIPLHRRPRHRTFSDLWWFLPGAIAFAVVDGALSWDGSYYLFRTLSEDAPPVFQHRYASAILTIPTWLISRFTHSVGPLITIFSWTYALIPLGVLIIAMVCSGPDRQRLFPWAAIGVGLVTLPVQFFGVSEALLVAQLLWPLTFLATRAPSNRRLLGGAVLAVALVLLHPISVFPLALLCCASAFRWLIDRQYTLKWAGLFLIATVLRVLIPLTPYEQQSTGPAQLQPLLQRALQNRPAEVLVLTFVASVLLFLSHRAVNRWVRLVALMGAAGIVVTSGVYMIEWVRQPVSWLQVMDYRSLTVFAELPILLLCYFDDFYAANVRLPLLRDDRVIVAISGVTFSVVLVLQSSSWHAGVNDYSTALDHATPGCVAEVGLVQQNPALYDFWTNSPLSVVLQGNHVKSVALSQDGCRQWNESQTLPIAPGVPPVRSGFFTFPKAR